MFDIILINYLCMIQVKSLVNQFELNPRVSRIVIINNSRSDIAEWSSFDLSPKVICASALHNTGYAGGNQLAFEILQSLNSKNHLCVLNADVEIPNDIFDSGLALFSKNKNIGQVSFRTENENGEFSFDALKLRGLTHEKCREHTRSIVKSDYAAGSFFLIRNRALADIDYLFFEPFFLYWEEVDLSFRLRKSGWKIVCCTDRVIVRNPNSPQAETRSVYYLLRNSFLFARRNQIENPRWAKFIFRYLLISVHLALSTRSVLPVFNFFAGFYDGVREKNGQR